MFLRFKQQQKENPKLDKTGIYYLAINPGRVLIRFHGQNYNLNHLSVVQNLITSVLNYYEIYCVFPENIHTFPPGVIFSNPPRPAPPPPHPSANSN